MIIPEDISSIISRVGNKFFALSGQKLFITGGTGFIGSYLLKTVASLNDNHLKNPCNVIVLSRNPDAFFRKLPDIAKRSDFKFIKGDIVNFDVSNFGCDYIIHAATVADPLTTKNDPLGSMETITRGTLNVLNLAEKNKVKAFLFLSSGAVYGIQPPELKQIPEDFIQGPELSLPASGYAEGKRYGEMLCSIYHQQHGIPAKVARLFTFTGPYLDLNAQYAVSDFIKKCLGKEPIVVTSDGTPVRSYCYSTDLTVALWEILLSNTRHTCFNVGSDDSVSISSLAGFVSSCFDKVVPVIINESASEGKLPSRYLPDITRLKDNLDFNLQYDSFASVKRTIDWIKESSTNINQQNGKR
jgi:nucleoside-diphosphate-sugar epimerase